MERRQTNEGEKVNNWWGWVFLVLPWWLSDWLLLCSYIVIAWSFPFLAVVIVVVFLDLLSSHSQT